MATLDHGHVDSGPRLGELVGRSCRRWSTELLQALVVSADAVLIFLTLMGVSFAYHGFGATFADPHVIPTGALVALSFVFFMALRGGYRVSDLTRARRQTGLVIQAWSFAFFAVAWVAFLLKATDALSRASVSLWFVFGGLVLAIVHGFGARALARGFVDGHLAHSRVAVIVVADDGAATRIVERLSQKGVSVASLHLVAPYGTAERGGRPSLATAAQSVRGLLAVSSLDGVYVFVSWSDRRRIDEVKAALAPLPVPLHLFADHEFERMLQRPLLRVGGLVGVELQRAPLGRFDRIAKRTVDVVVAATGLVVMSPIMAMTAAAIVVESGFPILFRQHRKGFGARPFAILKFRSMTVRENGDDVVQATRGDVRVTRIGRVIRRTSIDELPQLINVLKGEMSIVGPRPHALAHDDLYDGLIASYALRQHVKPGITGWAQINGLRGETREVEQMMRRVEHDLWYINNWSIWLDLRIIATTALKVVFDEGAF